MSSGPAVVIVLQGDNAIKKNRELMGATDPAKAEANTIRKTHGANIEFNAVHGSDSPETAAFEVGYGSPTALSRAFRELTGVSPREWLKGRRDS
jgi:nucleoside-diphosphate kinase